MIVFNANYKFYDGTLQTVPAPCDAATPNVDWWYDKLSKNASNYKRIGYRVVALPPPTKAQGGQANNADGYGLTDPFDLGNKNQCFSVNTRFGTLEQLRRLVAINNANGLETYIDYVFHQRDGGKNEVYQFPSATGKTNGRWPLTPDSFKPADPVFNTEGNFAFGDMCAYVNSLPMGYMADNAVGNLDWMVRTLGVTGMRLDDVKGSNSAFVERLATARTMGKLFKYAECFDGNPANLNAWVESVGYSCSAIDFTMHWALKSVCDLGGDASQLLGYNAGYFKTNPFKALTYVESPDTDNSPGEQIAFSKGLAYWFLLTSEGMPQVYYRDWSNDPHCYNLAPLINNLSWIHENLAFGTTTARYGDHSVACFERTGNPGLLTAGNWDTYNRRTITVQTDFGSNVQLHDYTGHAGDVWTDWEGKVTITIPPNAYGDGKSYVCYSRPGYTQPFSLEKRSTTQEFFGAVDLDVGPAKGGGVVTAGRIWCDANTKISINPGDTATGLTIGILNADGMPVSLSSSLEAETARRGFYTLTVGAPSSVTEQAFYFAATYTGTQDLHDSEAVKTATPAFALTHEKEVQQ